VKQRKVGHGSGVAVVSRSSVPHDRLGEIRPNALALLIEPTQTSHSTRITEVGGSLEPNQCFGWIGLYAVTVSIHPAKINH
jgi:hypothetical protein